MSEMYEMGNSIKLREDIDQQQRITNHIRSNLSTIDLIPTNYQLSLQNVNKGNWGIKYDVAGGIKNFKKALNAYGGDIAGASGLRLWLTDDSVVSDSFSNNFNKNIIESGVDSLSGLTTGIRSIGKALGNDNKMGDGIKTKAKAGADYMAGAATKLMTSDVELAKAIEGAVGSATDAMADVIFDGKHISLPKIWTSTTYAPTLTVTVKLVSPYGSKEAIKAFIIEPIVALLALTSPQSNDGVTYGLSQPIQVKGYGITNMNLACIQNVSIRRGGRETAFNIYKQPLILDVMLTIAPLADGFAAICDKGKDIASLDDATTPMGAGGTQSGPAFTTIGNIINSLRPAAQEVTGAYVEQVQEEHRKAPPGNLRSGAQYAINALNFGNIGGDYGDGGDQYS